jgi:hypothetical protein
LLRLAAKRAHKKEKSDAKKARKENAVLHRRATKNREKYTKNKDRNAARDLEGERKLIRRAAEDQLKRLTGEKFEGLGRPVLPDGMEVPEGEENFFALFDLTDEEIKNRLAKKKTAKKDAARKLRRQQMEMKKLNRALKARRKECENKGMVFDVQAATKEILDAQGGKDEEKGEDGEWEDEPENGDGESGESPAKTSKRSAEDEITEEPKAKKQKKKNPPNIPKINMTLLDPASVTARIVKEKKKTRRYLKKIDAVAISLETGKDIGPLKKKDKRAKEDGEVEEYLSHKEFAEKKAAEKEEEERRVEKEEEKKRKKAEKAEQAAMADPAEEKKRKEEKKAEKKRKKVENARKALEEEEKQKEEKERQKAEKAAAKAAQEEEKQVESALPAKESSKEKKKKKKQPEETSDQPAEATEALAPKEKSSKKRKHKSTEEDVEKQTEEDAIASQWNPDALSGDAERKSKFLRLLGGGKGAAGGESNGVQVNGDGKTKKGEIEKVQGELERQYEMGMKMKHEGGGKRRGLGA